MKTMVILSDTHGHREGIRRLERLFAENDYVLHLGDDAADMREVSAQYPEKTFVCQGNCDLYPALSEWELDVEGVRVFFCHGHRYRVKSGLTALAEEAKKRGCGVALYGHTHRAFVGEVNGVQLVNPGSLKAPAGEGGSYAYLVVNGDKATATIVGESVF